MQSPHFEGSPVQVSRSVVVLSNRGTPNRHDFIANELIQCAFVAEDNVDHHFEILVEERQKVLSFKLLGHLSESANVSKQDGCFSQFASFIHRNGSFHDLFDKIWREEA